MTEENKKPKKLFGTDGVRGLANQFPMTPEIAMKLGQAIAYHFAQKKGGGRIVIGKDTRRSSYLYEYALCAGIASMGSTAILTGPLPTPGVAFLTNTMRADAGVMISASHNAYYDNGIKFFDPNGFKLDEELEKQMELFCEKSPEDVVRPINDQIGRAYRVEDAVGRYVQFLKTTFPRDIDLTGVKVVVDCAHGAGYQVAPMVLQELGAEVITLGINPNGVNINDNVGALHPEAMARVVKESGAVIGIAIDGDGDRLIVSDEKGNVVDGDQVLALCALELQKENKLTHNTIVGTVMTNVGVEVFLKNHGIQLVRTSVGDKFIVHEMKRGGYSLGGEPSGHLIFLDLATTGDGVLAGLQVLALIKKTGKPLSELIREIPLYPQLTQNIKVVNKKDLDTIPQVSSVLHQVREQLGDKGRVILRYSGTEPLLRVTCEGESTEAIAVHLKKLTTVIEGCLNS